MGTDTEMKGGVRAAVAATSGAAPAPPGPAGGLASNHAVHLGCSGCRAHASTLPEGRGHTDALRIDITIVFRPRFMPLVLFLSSAQFQARWYPREHTPSCLLWLPRGFSGQPSDVHCPFQKQREISSDARFTQDPRLTVEGGGRVSMRPEAVDTLGRASKLLCGPEADHTLGRRGALERVSCGTRTHEVCAFTGARGPCTLQERRVRCVCERWILEIPTLCQGNDPFASFGGREREAFSRYVFTLQS